MAPSFLLEAGGFHTDTLVEDQEMTLTLLHMQKKVAYEPRAVAYTETPHSVKNFLKQRFRWVYGTMQCFWKHKSVLWERPDSVMSLVVMPNIFVYNILLPLTYPFADWAFIFGLIFGEWQTLVVPFLLFTIHRLVVCNVGFARRTQKWKLMLAVPLQRVVYRQLLYYTVYRALSALLKAPAAAGINSPKRARRAAFIWLGYGRRRTALGIETAGAGGRGCTGSVGPADAGGGDDVLPGSGRDVARVDKPPRGDVVVGHAEALPQRGRHIKPGLLAERVDRRRRRSEHVRKVILAVRTDILPLTKTGVAVMRDLYPMILQYRERSRKVLPLYQGTLCAEGFTLPCGVKLAVGERKVKRILLAE